MKKVLAWELARIGALLLCCVEVKPVNHENEFYTNKAYIPACPSRGSFRDPLSATTELYVQKVHENWIAFLSIEGLEMTLKLNCMSTTMDTIFNFAGENKALQTNFVQNGTRFQV